MTLPGTLTVLAAAANGLLAGLSLEVALVKLPSRRRLGPVAYARVSATLPLPVASRASVLHFVATARAAPIMLGIGRAPDDPGVLQPRLDAFARWHHVRAALQVLTFFVLLWALAST